MIVLYFIVVLLLLLDNRSKGACNFAICILWVLFAFNLDNADRGVYISRLVNYEGFDSITEPLFTLLMSVFVKLHFDVQAVYIFVSSLFCISILFLRKMSRHFGLALGGYMIANFFLDVVQLRFTLSISLFYLGIWYHINIKNNTKASIIYTFFILMAACIHATAVLYLSFLFIRSKYNNTKNTIILSLILMFIVALFVSYYSYNLDFLYEKYENISNVASDRYTVSSIIRRIIFILAMFFFYIYSYKTFYAKEKIYLPITTNTFDSQKNDFMANYMLHINILSIGFLPLLFFSADFHRIFYALYIFNLTIISQWTNARNQILLTFLTVILSGLLLHSLSLGGNADSVFWAVLNNNLLYKL